ncbi:hypothetical protein SAMN04488012_11230 [Palleronia salina]|uniref:Uncharacterized protein n=1 Tax=Palleronia salina TaxID=313368 RepID=A0A1M6KJG0_9RHOB|nr:hypothetical protein [Palleronia salina]SHJ59123.1 hypothetical protein SAMN04488012_11230 [Palleronia salina]
MFSLTDPFRRRPAALARLPRIVRIYILNAVFGFALAAIFTGLVLWFDVAGIGHLVTHVAGGWFAAAIFFVLNGIVFAGVQSGIAIMSLGRDEGPGGGPREAALVTAPIKERV